MAIRSWLKLLATTTTAAAVVGAGQLGIAYGLGMVRLDQTLEITQRDQWTAQLAWIAWIAMTAAAIGSVVATGLRPRWSPRPVGTGGAFAMGVAAGLGALAVLPLTMQPARTALVAGVQPVLVIGICAGLGAAAGIFAGWSAAARAVARWSLSTLAVAVWVVALVSVVPSLLPGKTPAPVRLGVLEGALIPASVVEHTQFATMPVVALLAGLVVGWIARGRKKPALVVALSGLAGPALLTVAYLIAGPGSASSFELNPYWAAMTASGAGVLGSVLAAIVRGTSEAARAPGPEAPVEDSPADARPEPPAAATPAGRAALPRRDVPVQSAIAQAAAAAARRPESELRPSDTGVFTVSMADRPHPLQDLAAVATTPGPTFPAPAVQPSVEPRFSGQQQPTKAGGGLRRGWRTRKSAPVPEPGAPSPALTGDTGSFNGFTPAQPGPRTGIDTAEHPRINRRAPLTPEPTAISAPLPQPTPIAPPPKAPAAQNQRPAREDDYVNWVNGLGK